MGGQFMPRCQSSYFSYPILQQACSLEAKVREDLASALEGYSAREWRQRLLSQAVKASLEIVIRRITTSAGTPDCLSHPALGNFVGLETRGRLSELHGLVRKNSLCQESLGYSQPG